ncbi:MAG: hypothetical protein NVSMB59_19910 [Vulcanimicrobiaceae bacterium]
MTYDDFRVPTRPVSTTARRFVRPAWLFAVYVNLTAIRAHATAFFVTILWLHVPLVALVAERSGSSASDVVHLATYTFVAAFIATVAYRLHASCLVTRLTIAAAMTAAPALLVCAGRGPWQADYHMYFFVVFAMLAAYIDVRPIAFSALLTVGHHLFIERLFPGSVFPEPGVDRALFHGAIVAIECATLFWTIRQTHALFVNYERALGLAESALEERADAQSLLEFNALHDDLTGLPNRALFSERVEAALGRLASGEIASVAVLFVDCDRLKTVYDMFGRAGGDRTLIASSDRLRRNIDRRCFLARLESDEFAVLVQDEDVGSGAASEAARVVIENLAKPLTIDGYDVVFGASVGIAMTSARDGSQTPATLLRDADHARYRAKSLGGSRFEYFTPEVLATTTRRRTLQMSLARALERHEMHVVFQPIVALPSRRPVGCEALLRWKHGDLGPISPVEFIEIAEETGLIVSLGEFVLREACAHAARWLAYPEISPRFCVSVNVSVKQMTADGFVASVVDVLAASGLAGRNLNLEITESLLMTSSLPVMAVLAELRGLGIGVHLDDFGTGYSSLAYLHEFPVQTLKIDRSFVSGRDGDDIAHLEIVRTILALASHFGLAVTAEGVETELQAQRLVEFGCRSAQGYLFSRPLEPAALAAYVGAEHALS